MQKKLFTKIAAKKPVVPAPKQLDTSWGKVADWYHENVEEQGSYQKDLILPNLLRLMEVKKGETVLDLACGEGFFSRRLAKFGANVIGADIAPELIALARKEDRSIAYHVSSADNLSFVQPGTVDKAVIVLALQNIENAHGTLAECSRVLKRNGKLWIVLNHPAFRIPKASSWGYDEKQDVQYRRLDRYISELREKIEMHPSASSGKVPGVKNEHTVSFHRPLQFYVKALKKAGFAVTGLEEWNSEKKSQPGPRAQAENRARAEFPLFLLLEATKS